MWATLLTTTTVLTVWRAGSATDSELFDRLASGRPPRAVVDKLESAFLSSFGMRQRPRQPVQVPDYLRHIYAQVAPTTRELNTLDLNLPGQLTASANTVHTFVHSDSKVEASKYPAHLQRLWFNVTTVPTEEMPTAAELRLWWHVTDAQVGSGRHSVQVYDIVRRTGAGGRPVLRLVDAVAIPARSGSGQLTLDVRPAVHRWLNRPQANHGLLVRVLGADAGDAPRVQLRRPRVVADEDGDDAWQRQQPLLVVYTDDGRPRSRVRRRAGGGGKRRHEECRRRRLYVDFTEVGWNNWIVAPPGYDAYFCQGECNRFPMPAHLNATNHAIVQTLVYKKGSGVPPPCCIATEMSSISMLYTNDHGRVVLKNYQDMVVEQCGCR